MRMVLEHQVLTRQALVALSVVFRVGRAGLWGDYVDLVADPRRTTYWIASGFVLDGSDEGRDLRPHVVTFAP